MNYMLATMKLFIYLSSALALEVVAGILAACKLKAKDYKEDLN